MSLWDDISKYGAGALDSLGEGADVFIKTYAQKAAEEKAADPKAHNQVSPLENADGKTIPQMSNSSMVSNDTLLIIGGVLFVGVAGLLLLKRGK